MPDDSVQQALDMVMRGLRFLGQAADINLEEHRIWSLAVATARWADEEGWSRDNFTWRLSKEGPLRVSTDMRSHGDGFADCRWWCRRYRAHGARRRISCAGSI